MVTRKLNALRNPKKNLILSYSYFYCGIRTLKILNFQPSYHNSNFSTKISTQRNQQNPPVQDFTKKGINCVKGKKSTCRLYNLLRIALKLWDKNEETYDKGTSKNEIFLKFWKFTVLSIVRKIPFKKGSYLF